MTEEELDKSLPGWRERITLEEAKMILDSEPAPKLDKPSESPPIEKQIKPQWEPCVYRETIETSCCPKNICRCPGCPLIGKVVKKSQCRECEYRDGNIS